MSTSPPTPRRIAATALLLGPAAYLAAEAITAEAWSHPTYSYVHNWISDLGSSTTGVFQGREIDSPLHVVMNAGFTAQGLLLSVGMVTLSRTLPVRLRRASVAVSVATTVGYLLLALFHGSPTAAEDGTLALHFLGAALAILGANTLAILLGTHWSTATPTRRSGRLSVALGVMGLVGVVALILTMNTAVPSGFVERVCVYPAVGWQVCVALQLLARPERSPYAPAAELSAPAC